MKKVFIACFLAIIMLMVPITSSVKTENISTTNDEMPKFYITEDQKVIIDTYIETNFEGEDKEEAINLVNEVIAPDYEVYILILADRFQEYTFQEIPDEELSPLYELAKTQPAQAYAALLGLIEDYWGFKDGQFIENLFRDLINKIVELIQERLGWVYEFLNNAISLFRDGINVIYGFIAPAAVLIYLLAVEVLNDILAIPSLFSEILTELFNGEYNEFIDSIVSFTNDTAGDIVAFIDEIIDFFNNENVKAYLRDIQDFIAWLDTNPWEDDIEITGRVTTFLGEPWTGLTITCKGQTTTTDSNGYYSFFVNPSPDEDSLPQNQYYGIHNCQITVTQNGELKKETPKLLSYSFSGGKITWPFLLKKVKSRDTGIRANLFEKINFIFERIQIFLSNLFWNIHPQPRF
jgi:hypothetical protein